MQHRFSTHFAAKLRSKLHVFIACLTIDDTSWHVKQVYTRVLQTVHCPSLEQGNGKRLSARRQPIPNIRIVFLSFHPFLHVPCKLPVKKVCESLKFHSKFSFSAITVCKCQVSNPRLSFDTRSNLGTHVPLPLVIFAFIFRIKIV